MLRNIFSLLANPVYAQTYNGGGGLDSDAPPQISELAFSIDRIISLFFPIGVIICVAMIIFGGYMWMVSGGEPSRKQQAQGTLTWAVLGLVFLLLIRLILTLIIDAVM